MERKMLNLKLQDKVPGPEIRSTMIDILQYTLKQEIEFGRTHCKNKGQLMDQTLHRVATKEREEIKGTTKQKMARRHSKEEGNRLEQESKRQKTMEGFVEGNIRQRMDKA